MEFKLKSFKKELEVLRMANVHYFEFTNKYHTASDRHPFRELIYVDSGTLTVRSDGYEGALTKNSLIIHKAMEAHSLKCPDDAPCNVIIIGFECKCEALDRFSSQVTELDGEQQNLLSEIIRDGRSVFLPPYDQPSLKDMKKRQSFPFGADQMIKIKLELLLINLVQASNSAPHATPSFIPQSKISDVTDYLNQNYHSQLSLDELCFLFKTNKTSLCSHFKQAHQCTIIDYVNRLRIKDAKMHLREGKLNITQISQALGFSSIHYFSRIFKKYTGFSPAAYTLSLKSKFDLLF